MGFIGDILKLVLLGAGAIAMLPVAATATMAYIAGWIFNKVIQEASLKLGASHN